MSFPKPLLHSIRIQKKGFNGIPRTTRSFQCSTEWTPKVIRLRIRQLGRLWEWDTSFKGSLGRAWSCSWSFGFHLGECRAHFWKMRLKISPNNEFSIPPFFCQERFCLRYMSGGFCVIPYDFKKKSPYSTITWIQHLQFTISNLNYRISSKNNRWRKAVIESVFWMDETPHTPKAWFGKADLRSAIARKSVYKCKLHPNDLQLIACGVSPWSGREWSRFRRNRCRFWWDRGIWCRFCATSLFDPCTT